MHVRLVLLTGLLAAVALGSGPAARAGADAFTVDIVIAPSNVVLGSPGTWVTVHAEIPYSAVDGAEVTLDGVPVVYTKSDNRGEFVAKFALDDVQAILSPGTVTLTLGGWTKEGVPFSGTDEIRVTTGGKK